MTKYLSESELNSKRLYEDLILQISCNITSLAETIQVLLLQQKVTPHQCTQEPEG
jgi:hypothetical protein